MSNHPTLRIGGTATKRKEPCILLIEFNPQIRDLNRLILEEAGYQVATVPTGTDPVAFAAHTTPDAIVVSIHTIPRLGAVAGEPSGWDPVDRLEADPKTRAIPVVAISAESRTATEAQAAPSVRAAVVMPYDISALQDAVAHALGNPPPAAVLPPATQPVPATITFICDRLTQNARTIVLRAIRRLQQTEPFSARFAELSPGLIDDLPVIYGAIVDGIRRGLSPDQVFAVPDIKRAITEHVRLRKSQHLGPLTVAVEYDALRDEITDFLHSQIEPTKFTCMDAFGILRLIDSFTDQLIQVVWKDFQPTA